MSTTGFHLRPLKADDVQDCARIADEAFRDDRQTQFKARNPTEPYSHAEAMQGAFNHWLGRPAGSVEGTVAIDDATARIVGWVVWGFRGFNSPEAVAEREKQLLREAASNQTNPGRRASRNTSNRVAPPASQETTSDRTRLEKFTSADFKDWMEYIMPPGTRCMYICSIVVLPDFQGRGIGSALIKQGISRADVEKVFCWVHSSESGAKAFTKHGFQELRRLEIDLDEWNSQAVLAPDGLDHKWGLYTFRYMVRKH